MRVARSLGIAAIVAAAIVGCVQLRDFASPTAPELPGEWRSLLDELRRFERRIGYQETKNFVSVTGDRERFPFCGQASSLKLPYSYEDPAIRWLDSVTEEQCRETDPDTDVYFGTVEALGEIGTPVTPAMISSKLDRFIYLVIHEDCHDQFDLPYGIEEALCNVITYHAMAQFSTEKFRWYSRENRAIKSYTGAQSRQTRATISHYHEVEALYARYQRAEISAAVLLRERAPIFAHAERSLEFEQGVMNNVIIANYMTYSRHYPYLERVFASLGRDLGRTVAFFREVDKRKPPPAEVMKRHGIKNEKSVEFVRAYENAVIETIATALAESRTTPR